MDPFRYHDSNEGPVYTPKCRSGQMKLFIPLNGSPSAQTVSVPLMLPDTPGEYREIETMAGQHVIKTKAQCVSPNVHVITTFVHTLTSAPEVSQRPVWPGESVKPCSFCKKNGERPELYNDHQLHQVTHEGKRVSCPVLRSVKCPICGATGDTAHTLSHCPHSKNRVSVALMLKNTARQGNGSYRRREV